MSDRSSDLVEISKLNGDFRKIVAQFLVLFSTSGQSQLPALVPISGLVSY